MSAVQIPGGSPVLCDPSTTPHASSFTTLLAHWSPDCSLSEYMGYTDYWFVIMWDMYEFGAVLFVGTVHENSLIKMPLDTMG